MSGAALRVGFPAIGGDQWKGGQNYLQNLLHALRMHAHDRIAPVLFAYPGYAPDLIEHVQQWGVEVVTDDFFAPHNARSRLARATIIGRDAGAGAIYARHRLDLIFENAHYHGWRFDQPTLAWFPDFQHQHMPHLFSRAGWWRRELGFRLSMMRNEHVLLSSQDALHDLDRFYAGYRCQVHVVPFAINPPAPVPDSDVRHAASALGIEQGWFFLPNHFWIHKNHEVVVRAVAQLKARHPEITVVCTGNTHDPRNPDHFRRLEAMVREGGLETNFRVLGLVPYAQLTALMRGAIALINPSKFEGWSTVVEEAKVYATPLILSDIGVHREQCGSSARYFMPDDALALAHILERYWQGRGELPVRADPAEMYTAASERFAIFASRFAAACESAAGR